MRVAELLSDLTSLRACVSDPFVIAVICIIIYPPRGPSEEIGCGYRDLYMLAIIALNPAMTPLCLCTTSIRPGHCIPSSYRIRLLMYIAHETRTPRQRSI